MRHLEIVFPETRASCISYIDVTLAGHPIDTFLRKDRPCGHSKNLNGAIGGRVNLLKIEVLYLDGCPNYVPAVERLREVSRQENISAEIIDINVTDDAKA